MLIVNKGKNMLISNNMMGFGRMQQQQLYIVVLLIYFWKVSWETQFLRSGSPLIRLALNFVGHSLIKNALSMSYIFKGSNRSQGGLKVQPRTPFKTRYNLKFLIKFSGKCSFFHWLTWSGHFKSSLVFRI